MVSLHGDYSTVCNSTNSVNITENSFSASLYPNPTKDETVLQFSLQKADKVSIAIYDALGNLAEVNMTDSYVVTPNKIQTMTIRTDRLSSGLYYLVLKTESDMNIQTLPLTVTK